jgi:hypothetical protein
VFRNFLYSGICESLRASYRVVLCTVVPAEYLRPYLQEQCDALYELKPTSELSKRSGRLYDFTEWAHAKYLWSKASSWRWNARKVELKKGVSSRGADLTKGRTRLAKKAYSELKIAQLRFTQWLASLYASNSGLMRLERKLLRVAAREPVVGHYQQILIKENPVFVFNGSHVHAKNAYALMQAAILNGIKTGTFLFSWDNLTSQGRILPPADYYFAWNSAIRNDLLKSYPVLRPEQALVTGTPQFVAHFDSKNYMPRGAFLQQLGLAPHQKFVVYSVGMSHHMPFEPLVVERIADFLAKQFPDVVLVVRTYAKDLVDAFGELKARRPDVVIPPVKWEQQHQTPLMEDQIFFTNLLLHCELGINVASTISLELCMHDKPVVNIAYDPPGKDIYPYNFNRFYEFEHYKPLLTYEAILLANTEEACFEGISNYLQNPALHRENRAKLIADFFELKVPGNENAISSSSRFLDSFVGVVSKISSGKSTN